MDIKVCIAYFDLHLIREVEFLEWNYYDYCKFLWHFMRHPLQK